MGELKDRLQEMMLELSTLKARARGFEEHELADKSLEALRAEFARFCKRDYIVFRRMDDDKVR